MRYVYEVRPCKDKRGVDLISDALPFGRLWYGEPDAVRNEATFSAPLFNDHLIGIQRLVTPPGTWALHRVTKRIR